MWNVLPRSTEGICTVESLPSVGNKQISDPATAYVRRLRCWAFCAASMLAAAEATAQERPQAFSLKESGATLSAGWFYESLDRLPGGSRAATTQTEAGAEQEIMVSASGSVYHSNLLQFAGSVALQFRQSELESYPDSYAGPKDERLSWYHSTFTLLRNKIVGSTLQLDRSISRFNSTYAPTRTFLITVQSLNWNHDVKGIPLGIVVANQTRESRGSYQTKEHRKSARVTGQHQSGMRSESLALDWQDWRQRNPDVNLDSFGVEFQQALQPTGVDNPWHLSTRWNYLDSRGALDQMNLAGDLSAESRRWRRFRARGGAALSRYETNARSVQGYSARCGVTHRLYESVISSVDGSWVTSSETGFKSSTLKGIGRVVYRKQIPGGAVSLRASNAVSSIDNSLADALERSESEDILVQFDTPILLERRDVDPFSVVVAGIAEIGIFREGFDYTLVSVGDRVEILFLASGEIPEGELVRVQYQYDAGDELRYRTHRKTAGASWSVGSYFSVSGSWERMDEVILEGQPLRPGAIEDRGVSVALALGPSHTRCSYRVRDEEQTPFSQESASQSFDFSFWRPVHFALRGSYARTEYTGRQDVSETWRGSTRLSIEPNWRNRLSLDLSTYRVDQPGYRDYGKFAVLVSRVQIHALTFDLEARWRFDSLDRRGRDEASSVTFRITRRIL
jgi:hypothetical protein